jgi:hypothetical protein
LKTRILEHVAPAHYGKISLNDAYRLFSHFGSLKEIEKCLDGLVKCKAAQKVVTSQGKLYVFEDVALQFGKRWDEELKNLKIQSVNLEKEISFFNKEMEVTEKLREMWLGGWDDVLKDVDTTYASVNNYISSVFFGRYINAIITRIREGDEKLRVVNKKIEEIENVLKGSYESYHER